MFNNFYTIHNNAILNLGLFNVKRRLYTDTTRMALWEIVTLGALYVQYNISLPGVNALRKFKTEVLIALDIIKAL